MYVKADHHEVTSIEPFCGSSLRHDGTACTICHALFKALFREEIFSGYFAIHDGVVSSICDALRSDECVQHTIVASRNLAEYREPFSKMFLILFCDHEFAIGKLDFAEIDHFVRTNDEKVDLRPLFGQFR